MKHIRMDYNMFNNVQNVMTDDVMSRVANDFKNIVEVDSSGQYYDIYYNYRMTIFGSNKNINNLINY